MRNTCGKRRDTAPDIGVIEPRMHNVGLHPNEFRRQIDAPAAISRIDRKQKPA